MMARRYSPELIHLIRGENKNKCPPLWVLEYLPDHTEEEIKAHIEKTLKSEGIGELPRSDLSDVPYLQDP